MSFSTLRVELPAYSHSFQVQVTPSSSVRDVKHEIAKVCPGSPSPEGQRLIWRGRFLRDEEKVEDIWKSPEDSPVIHLAVHPSAWSSTPPSLPSPPPSTHSNTRPDFTQSQVSAGQPTLTYWQQPPFTQSHPYPHLSTLFPSVAYIQHMHSTALGILSAGGVTLPTPPSINELEAWRSAAKDLYRSQGWVWPDIFEQPFPSGSPGQGATYQPVTVEGLPYLQLTNADATPTPSQLHALRVLSHTFSLLSMVNDPMLYVPATAHYPHPYSTATNVNQHLQQLGLPHLRLAQGAIPNPHDPNNHNPLAAPAPGVPGAEIRAIPVRALMIPLIMLVFRTLLLLYFFSPSKRPLFGLLLSMWILYEAWNAMRLVLNDGNDREVGGPANPGAVNGAAGAGQPAGGAGAGPNVNGNGAANGRSQAGAVLDRLSTLNLAAEDAMLDTDAPVPEPGLAQKTKMFCALFFMTLWPSAWDRRRNALRRREGRIRTDANAREAVARDREQAEAGGDGQSQDGEQQAQRSEEDLARARRREQMVARHERRPAWLRQYVQRVEYTEWVDDP